MKQRTKQHLLHKQPSKKLVAWVIPATDHQQHSISFIRSCSSSVKIHNNDLIIRNVPWELFHRPNAQWVNCELLPLSHLRLSILPWGKASEWEEWSLDTEIHCSFEIHKNWTLSKLRIRTKRWRGNLQLDREYQASSMFPGTSYMFHLADIGQDSRRILLLFHSRK